jgi:hypothetical protein
MNRRRIKMPRLRTAQEFAPLGTDRPLRRILVVLFSTYAIAVAIAVALPHSGIPPLLSIAAPVLGFAIPMAVLVAGFLVLRKGADFNKARPTAQRPTIQPRVEARRRQ